MIQIKRKIIVKKPVQEVWKVLFEDFTKVGNWVTGVYTSRPGTKEEDYDRVCDTFTGKLYEKIIQKNEKNYSFEVDAVGLPFFVKTFRGKWNLSQVTPTTTEATLELTIDVKGIIGAIMQVPMKSKLNKGLNELGNDLVTFAETGNISNSKQKEMNKKRN